MPLDLHDGPSVKGLDGTPACLAPLGALKPEEADEDDAPEGILPDGAFTDLKLGADLGKPLPLLGPLLITFFSDFRSLWELTLVTRL
ncbi:MAG: hypothetical protein JKY99_00660 [Rhizobiales bacterium]|nr:hypothetical protein [Hyphomicrobiales bacterium]